MTKQVRLRKGISRLDFQALLHFGTGVTIANSFGNIAYYVDNVIVARLLGSIALGLYQMAFQIMDLPRRFLGSIIDRVIFAALARVQDDNERMRVGYFHALELANVILVPMTVLFIVIVPETVNVLLGNKWIDLVLPLQILLVQVPLRASLRMADNVGTAVGKVYDIAFLKLLYAIMIGVAAVIGVQQGLAGVAFFVTIAVIINWILMVRFTLRIIDASINLYLKTWIPACLAGLIILMTSGTIIGIMRGNILSEFIRLCVTVPVALLIFLTIIWVWPRVIGDTAINIILDFCTRSPILNKTATRLGKRIHSPKKPTAESASV
jgi:PST family polysaccharide transporter